MSYSLNVYIKWLPSNDLNDKIVSFFETYGLNILIHPEFELFDQSGFLPVVFEKNSKLLKKRFNFNILTGFELYIDNVEKDELEGLPLMKIFSHSITLRICDPVIEFLCSKIFAAALVYIFDGFLIDTYSGDTFSKNDLKKYLKNAIKVFKSDIKTIESERIHEFKEWL